jgi:hypothetical protein
MSIPTISALDAAPSGRASVCRSFPGINLLSRKVLPLARIPIAAGIRGAMPCHDSRAPSRVSLYVEPGWMVLLAACCTVLIDTLLVNRYLILPSFSESAVSGRDSPAVFLSARLNVISFFRKGR